jgi:hypothetical protein
VTPRGTRGPTDSTAERRAVRPRERAEERSVQRRHGEHLSRVIGDGVPGARNAFGSSARTRRTREASSSKPRSAEATTHPRARGGRPIDQPVYLRSVTHGVIRGARGHRTGPLDCGHGSIHPRVRGSDQAKAVRSCIRFGSSARAGSTNRAVLGYLAAKGSAARAREQRETRDRATVPKGPYGSSARAGERRAGRWPWLGCRLVHPHVRGSDNHCLAPSDGSSAHTRCRGNATSRRSSHGAVHPRARGRLATGTSVDRGAGRAELRVIRDGGRCDNGHDIEMAVIDASAPRR